jgi:hypothetical protein
MASKINGKLRVYYSYDVFQGVVYLCAEQEQTVAYDNDTGHKILGKFNITTFSNDIPKIIVRVYNEAIIQLERDDCNG